MKKNAQYISRIKIKVYQQQIANQINIKWTKSWTPSLTPKPFTSFSGQY